jgi:hypothetical protein
MHTRNACVRTHEMVHQTCLPVDFLYRNNLRPLSRKVSRVSSPLTYSLTPTFLQGQTLNPGYDQLKLLGGDNATQGSAHSTHNICITFGCSNRSSSHLVCKRVANEDCWEMVRTL